MTDLENKITGTPADGGKVVFAFESPLAKENFLNNIRQVHEKNERINSQKLTCGQCATYPCFRYPRDNDRAGLCYQEVRQCRQECDCFHQTEGSGKSPEFKITGTCREDNSKVAYEQECHIEKYKTRKK